MDTFRPLRVEFPQATTDQQDLLLHNQIFPYEDMNSGDLIIETSLSPKDAVYNSLRGEGLSAEVYPHPKKVWSAIESIRLLEYNHIYLKCMFFRHRKQYVI